MNTRAGIIVAGLWWLTVAGCAGKGEIVQLNLHAIPPADAQKVQPAADTIIVVVDFEDARSDKQRVGRRVHQAGGETVFDVPSGRAGFAVAQVVTDYLKKRGWRVELVKPGPGTAPDGGPHVTIAGRVLELATEANSAFGSTKITAASRIIIEAVNAEDGSIVRMTLKGNASQTVVVFSPEDAANLLSAALSESLEKFVADTKIEKKTLRLK